MVKVDMTLDLPTILSAHERIRPHIHRTLVLTSERLNEASGASLFFKCENFQKIGAFKARGATNAVLSLDKATARHGVATHSSETMGPQWLGRRSSAAFPRISSCRRTLRR